MKIKSNLTILCIALIITPTFLFGQSTPIVNEEGDIIFWDDTTGGLNNNVILDVGYDDDLNLHLLIKAEDDYGSRQAKIAKLDQDGQLHYSHLLNAGGNSGVNLVVSDLRNIYRTMEGGWKVTGTSVSNDRPAPYAESVDEFGDVNSFSYTIAFTPIYGGDNILINDSTVLSGSTSLGRAGFNMWIQAATPESSPKIHWSKKIYSEFNEYNIAVKTDADNNIYILGYQYLDEYYSTYCPVIYKTDEQGVVIWRRTIEQELNPFYLNMELSDEGNLYVTNAYGTEQTMNSHTEIYVFNPHGDSIAHKTIEQIRACGILSLSSGDLLLYGSNLKTSGNTSAQDARIAKAKNIVLNTNLVALNSDEMCEYDNPDFIMPSTMFIKPTSSEFLKAKELPNGRIVCVGRVYMPTTIAAGAILTAPSTNRALVVFTDPQGGFGNQIEKQ